MRICEKDHRAGQKFPGRGWKERDRIQPPRLNKQAKRQMKATSRVGPDNRWAVWGWPDSLTGGWRGHQTGDPMWVNLELAAGIRDLPAPDWAGAEQGWELRLDTEEKMIQGRKAENRAKHRTSCEAPRGSSKETKRATPRAGAPRGEPASQNTHRTPPEGWMLLQLDFRFLCVFLSSGPDW